MKKLISLSLLSLLAAITAIGQSSAFTYQGKLTDETPASSYDLIFRLCANETGDCSIPLATDSVSGVTLGPGGIFSVVIDFGTQNYHYNNDRFVEIAVMREDESEYITLSPRTRLTASPVSVYARTAVNSMLLDGLGASDFIQDSDPRIQENYNVRNTAKLQPNVDFNIGGTGTANILNAATQFNLGGERILSNTGSHNLFLGLNSGAINTGSNNAFFGKDTGRVNTTGGNNSFFGTFAGYSNSTASSNSFFGADSGFNTQSGASNSFFGSGAGYTNQAGNLNAFFGIGAGFNSLGSSNTFIGSSSGNTNTTGSNNTLVGASANVVVNNLTFATAIGGGATVGTSNSVVLGRPADTVRIPGAMNLTGDLNVDGTGRVNGDFNAASGSARVGIGIGTPNYKVHIVDPGNTGLRVITNTTGGTVASFGANGAFQIDGASGQGGRVNLLSNGNFGIGNAAPAFMLDVTGATNQGLRVRNTSTGGTIASFGSTGAFRVDSAAVTGGRLSILENGNVGIGNASPTAKLSVTGTGPTSTALEVNNGAIKVTGAGLNTNTAVFSFLATPANTCGSFIVIDNPYTNNDPNAILFVTLRTYNNGVVGSSPDRVPVLRYVVTGSGVCSIFSNRWYILIPDRNSEYELGVNVMVIKP